MSEPIAQTPASPPEPQPRRRSTAVSAGILGISNLMAMGLKLGGGLIVARLLEPAEMGVFTVLGLVTVYGRILQFGVINGLNRELPYTLGQGDKSRAEELTATALGWSLLCSSLVGLFMLGWLGLEAFRGGGRTVMALGVATVSATALFFQNYLEVIYRCRGRFVTLGIRQMGVGVFGFAMIALVWWLGFGGQCLRLVIVAVANVTFLWKLRPMKVRPSLKGSHLWTLAKIGVPIFIVGQMFSAWRGLDKVMVLRDFGYGSEAMGFYHIAFLTMQGGLSVIRALGMVVYPRMAHMYGRTKDPRASLLWSWKSTWRMAAIALPVFIGCWFLVDPAVRALLPKYAPGIGAAKWALVTIYPLCFLAPLNIYNVIRKQVYYAVVIGLSAGVFVLSLELLKLRYGQCLEIYPQAMAAATTFFAIAGNAAAFWLVNRMRGREGEATIAPIEPLQQKTPQEPPLDGR